MKKRVMSVMLVLVMSLGLLPATAFAAGDPFTCPTSGCKVTYDGSTYTHSKSDCPYADMSLYCEECGYLTYREDEDDYFHADN